MFFISYAFAQMILGHCEFAALHRRRTIVKCSTANIGKLMALKTFEVGRACTFDWTAQAADAK
jgi:hypothetical protein